MKNLPRSHLFCTPRLYCPILLPRFDHLGLNPIRSASVLLPYGVSYVCGSFVLHPHAAICTFAAHPWRIRTASVAHPWRIRGASVAYPWLIRGASVAHPCCIRTASVLHPCCIRNTRAYSLVEIRLPDSYFSSPFLKNRYAAAI